MTTKSKFSLVAAPMTAQEMFNKVAAHLLSQGKRAIDEHHRCRYRGANGTKCAIGCLITDDRYSPGIEASGAQDIHVREAAGYGIELIGLACDLQKIHDNASPANWRTTLENLATLYGLTTEVIK